MIDHKKMRWYVAALTGVLVMSGCGGASAPKETQSSAAQTQQETEVPETEAPETESVDLGDDVFTFTRENFPKMDGSTSLVPLGEAVASVLLGETREQAADLISFNRTTQSYRNLMAGDCQLILASEPNSSVFEEMKNVGFEIDMEAISNEALIFVVNEDNPVDSLTTEQIRQIYSGEITNWKDVGGEDAAIQAFQRNSGAGSQALMEKLVMGDTPMMEVPEEYMVGSMGELMESVKNYDNSADAIGYSVYYYANEMRMADGLKIIAVDGVEPSNDTIRAGEYPHTNAYYCAISAEEAEDSPSRILYDWLVSEEGQRLISEEGYVSVMEVD